MAQEAQRAAPTSGGLSLSAEGAEEPAQNGSMLPEQSNTPQEENKPGIEPTNGSSEQEQPDAMEKQEQKPVPVEGIPSDSAVTALLKEYLKDVTMDVTERQLRTRLEEHFGVPMKDRKQLIRNEVVEWLSTKQEEEAADGEDGNGEDSEADIDVPPGKRRKSGGGGLSATCSLSEPMQAFLGVKSMARTQVVRAMWDYIKANNLQNPKNKRKILLDEKLSTLFKSPLDMFSMNSQLSRHVYTLEHHNEDGDEPDEHQPNAKAKVKPGKTKADKPRNLRKPAKPKQAVPDGQKSKPAAIRKRKVDADPDKPKKPSNFTKPLKVSEELSEWLGGLTEISRPELTKRFWAYAKEKELLNPNDRREVICDVELRELTGQEKFQGFSFSKYINKHLLGPANAPAKE